MCANGDEEWRAESCGVVSHIMQKVPGLWLCGRVECRGSGQCSGMAETLGLCELAVLGHKIFQQLRSLLLPFLRWVFVLSLLLLPVQCWAVGPVCQLREPH